MKIMFRSHVSFLRPAAVVMCLLAVTACAKMPESLMSPAAKIDIETKDNREVFILKLNAGLRNENGDTALLKVKGRVKLTDPAKKSRVLAVMPFEVAAVLPYETAMVDVEKEFTESEIGPVANLLGVGVDELIKNRGVDSAPISEKSVLLEIDSCDRRGIVKLLRERSGKTASGDRADEDKR